MKIALIGRTRWLIDTGEMLQECGHEIVIIITIRAECFYGVDEDNFKKLSDRINAVFHENIQINSHKGIAYLKESGAELGVSVNWPSIIGEEACNALPYGILNAHAGDLPRYRGNACPNWAILNGESHVGLCIHEMEPGKLDSGPVICRDNFTLSIDSYIEDVYAWLARRIPELFVEAVNGVENGCIVPELQPDDPDLALRCYPRRQEDSEIDWQQSFDHIYRLIRASSRPFSGAYTTLEGKERVVIWRAEPYVHPGAYCAIPGQILFSVEGDPTIACGDGALRLTDIFLEGLEGSDAAKKEICSSLRRRLV